MPILARRTKQQATSNKQQATSNKQQANTRKFRRLFLESLETRKLMAADLDASATQDLLLRSLNPVQGASQPTANFSSFNSDRIIALDADSLNPRQASLIDNASRLSKVDYAPSSYLNQFRNQVPSQGQLQGSLIGSSTNPRLELNTTSDSSATTSSTTLDANTAEAGSIANGSFFSGLFTQGGRTANTRVLTAAQPLQVQWVGAFCDVDGTEVFPLSQSSNVVMSRLPEGEGDDDDDESIVPEVDFPTLESSSHIGEFDLFLPPSPSSSSSLTTFGAFTAASLTNPDLTLPGLNWVHLVDIYWVSPTQWSFTESLVLSFDLGNSVEDEGQESIVNGQGSNEDGPDGDDSSGDPDDDEDTGLDVESEWESSIGASRSGYFKFTFSASRGITTASAAGVRWSLLVDYLDSASVSAEASGRADFTPSDPSTNDDGGSSNGDDDELEAGGIEGGTGRDVIDTPQYPDDFTATSKWKASARISVETSGVIIVSSTPAIASDGEIDRTIAASITYDVDGDIEVSEEWSSSSQSGDISLVDFPVEDGDHPLGGCGTEIFDNGDAPGDGDNGEGEGGSGARGGRDPGTDPIGEVEGKGHASMSSGKSLNKAGGGLNGSFGLNGVLRNGRFSSLIGNALSDLETARENSGDGDHLFVFRDHKVTPVEYGQTVTTIVLKAGWTGIGKGDGSADGDGDTELGLNSEGVPQAVNDSTGVIDSDANGDGRDFVNLSFVETTTKNWNLMSEGLYGPIHHVGGSVDSFDLTYKSRSQGKSIGDVFGFASLQDRSADFESDLTGDGKSLLLVVTTHDYVEDINWMNYSGPTLTQLDEQYSQREDYFSKYDITGNATGVKNDDGSVSWTLDAKILDYSDVDYDYFSLYTTTETNTLDFFSNRVATFDAAKATRSTVVGGGTISPQPGGDTGGLTATESKSRSGDTEVSIIFAQTDTGEAATGLEIPVEKTDLELELEAMFASGEEEYTGTEGESGSGSSGQGSSADGSYSGRWLPTVSEVWGVTSAGFKGVAQGACNIVNGVQDAAVGVVNVAIAVPNGIASGIDYVTGVTDPHYQIRVPYVHSPDWSRNLITEEGGTPGGWDDMHGWSKFAGGEGAMALLTGGASKAASVVDDAGRCANWLTKFVHGGCFVAGTKVTVSELPYSKARESQVWSETEWLSNNDYSYSPSPRFGEKRPGDEGLGSEKFEVRSGNASSSAVLDFLKSHASYLKPALQVPIEQVPLGARVPTKNPKPWEYDDSLPDPVQADWAKISITMHRNDGGIVDAELIRPRWWIAQHSIVAGKHLPMNIEELQVRGSAIVTAIDDCPEIADGEGSIVTATFKTREVHSIVQAEILGPDGSIEIIEGTPIHPIWSVDRNDWVPLGELTEGDSLQAADGLATVLSLTRVSSSIPVYNVEVHGEHVFQVGDLGLLVHNSDPICFRAINELDDIAIAAGNRLMPKGSVGTILDHIQGYATKFISVSKSQAGAALYDTGRGVIKIDLLAAIKTGSTIVPHEQLLQVARRYGRPIDVKNVLDAQEFLIKGGIDFSAIIRS